MTVHEVDRLSQHVLAYDGIRVEQQHILTLALSDGDIVGPGEPQIMVTGYIVDMAVILFQIRHRIVLGMIIHDIHISLYSFKSLVETVETLSQIILYIITDYDDR
jgi:hypothetical protein